MDKIEVTQADQLLVADVLDEVSSLLDHNGIGQIADLIRDGEYDGHECVQIAARHRATRTNATPVAVEMVAELQLSAFLAGRGSIRTKENGNTHESSPGPTMDDYRRMARFALAEGQVDATPVAWMPIECAPKDGTTILLGAPAQTFQGNATEPRSTIGHWATKEECREVIGDCGGECRCPEYRYHEPYWLSWDGGFTEQNPPTHWMPLPDAPDATYTHPPATDVAALVEAAKKIMPIRVNDGPDYAEVYFADGTTHSTHAMTMNPQDWQALSAALAPFTKGQP